MKTIDITKYQTRIDSGKHMVTAIVITLEKFSTSIYLSEDDPLLIETLKKELNQFPYILNTARATVKVTAENFESIKEYRYNPLR